VNQVANAAIGAAIERVEDLRFLRGRGTYVGDLQCADVAHAVILRSSVAHGRIRSVDAAEALKMDGVIAVVIAADIGPQVPTIRPRMEPHPDYIPFQQPVIARDKVNFVGEPIAVVIANSAAMAEDALDAIVVDIEPLPTLTNCQESLRGDVLLVEGISKNSPGTLVGAKGDPDPIFASAPYVRRETFRVHRHSAVPLEPRGLLAEWDAEHSRMTVSGAAKVPFHNKRALAELMSLPADSVTMLENDVGGGFGVRGEFYPEDFLIPFAARLLGRPVRWMEDRRENLMATNHSREAECDVEIACDRDGRILALRAQSCVDMGAYVRTTGSTPPRNLAQVLSGPYRIPHLRSEVTMAMTNKTPSASYRGPGRFESDFFRERLFDLVAADLGIDRVEFRRRNLISEAEMPYPLATVAPHNIATECDSGDYVVTLDRCLEEIAWSKKAQLQGKLIDGRYHGLAVGCYLEGAASGQEFVRLQLDSDGQVSVFTGSSGIGQGLETVFTQIAADALGFPMDRIRGVFHGSTNLLSNGVGAFSSRSVVMGGSALLAAANSLKEAIRAAAAARIGCAASQIEIVNDSAVGPASQSIGLGELAGQGLSVEGTFATPKRTYSYGAHAVHVTVDPGTGQIDVLDYVAVEDVGRIINPHTLHGQCIGAIVQGLGGTLLEHFVYDENGQLLTGTLADYLLPTATDFPSIRAVAMELKPCPNNPLGAKGAGEGGIIPVGGVIANAVAAALSSLGVQPRELPLSPSRVWEMVQDARRPLRSP
jgi:carbon-monoxide dehydrogenase large subunit